MVHVSDLIIVGQVLADVVDQLVLFLVFFLLKVGREEQKLVVHRLRQHSDVFSRGTSLCDHFVSQSSKSLTPIIASYIEEVIVVM